MGRASSVISQMLIEKLTPDQQALIPVTLEQWRAIALSTQPIERQKAKVAVKAAYAAIGLSEPEILFFDSPYAALSELVTRLKNPLKYPLGYPLSTQLEDKLRFEQLNQLLSQLGQQLRKYLRSEFYTPMGGHLLSQLQSQLQNQLGTQVCNPLKNHIQARNWANDSSCLDFCISVLNCTYDSETWEGFQSLVKHTGWFFPYEKTCVVCDRPRRLSFDSTYCLDAKGEPAIQFADGFSVYATHGKVNEIAI